MTNTYPSTSFPRVAFLAVSFALLALTLFSCCNRAFAADEKKKSFDIPAGPALDTLRQFVAQSGQQLLYPAETVESIRTRPVKGNFTTLDALIQMFTGTNVQVVQDAVDGSLTIRRRVSDESRPRTERTPGRGTIEGRVFNVSSGNFLSSARLSVAGTNLETLSDKTGEFLLRQVPSGRVDLQVVYAGLEPQTVTVQVTAGATVRVELNLDLGRGTATNSGQVQTLNAFSVEESRLNAQSISLNERKNAANIRNVVAVDEFGDSGDGNAAELLKYVPGINIDYSSTVARGISVRGLPSSGTLVTIDGGEVASGTSNGTGRNVELDSFRLNNISRVEVTKVPTPDLPANAQGGAVNVISKSGFERKKPVFSYKAYTTFNSRGFETTNLDKRQGSRPDLSTGPFSGGFNLNYQMPVNRSLAFAFAAGHTSRFNRYREVFSNWNLTAKALSMTDIVPGERSTVASDAAMTAEWRSGNHHFRANILYVRGSFNGNDNRMRLLYGAGVTGGPDFVQGAATGVGTAAFSFPSFDRDQETGQYNLNYRYTRGPWKVEANASVGRDRISYHDVSEGFFGDANLNITNLVIRGDGISADSAQPASISAVDRNGRPVDVFDGGEYTINSVDSAWEFDITDAKNTAKFDLTREFDAVGPFSFLSVRVGAAFNQQERDLRRNFKRWNFRPTAAAADRQAKNYDVLDPAFSATAQPYYPGRLTQWVSTKKLYELFAKNPDYFVLLDGTSYAQNVLFSKNLREDISAGYLRTDAKLFDNRLWIVAGARYEKTENQGRGPLTDPNAVYQKDANGRLLRNPTTNALIPITTDAQARQFLLYKNRGALTETEYDGLFPSINSSYSITDDIIVRAAYARTMGRPNLTEIIPGLTISDPSSPTRSITVINTGLKPWMSDGFDLSLETYNVKGGVGTIGVFSKRIDDFFGILQTEATAETLEQYGVPEEFPGQYTGYVITTKQNVGSATIDGFELSYKQTMYFIPGWGKNVQAHANYTELKLKGANTADFTGHTPKTLNYGVSFTRPKYSLRFNVNYRGRIRSALQTPSATIPANTYNWIAPRTLVGADIEYRFSKRFAFYATAINLLDAEAVTERYSTTVATPDYTKVIRRFKFGADFNLGIKGTF